MDCQFIVLARVHSLLSVFGHDVDQLADALVSHFDGVCLFKFTHISPEDDLNYFSSTFANER